LINSRTATAGAAIRTVKLIRYIFLLQQIFRRMKETKDCITPALRGNARPVTVGRFR